jgi:hypothetical protein
VAAWPEGEGDGEGVGAVVGLGVGAWVGAGVGLDVGAGALHATTNRATKARRRNTASYLQNFQHS